MVSLATGIILSLLVSSVLLYFVMCFRTVRGTGKSKMEEPLSDKSSCHVCHPVVEGRESERGGGRADDLKVPAHTFWGGEYLNTTAPDVYT